MTFRATSSAGPGGGKYRGQKRNGTLRFTGADNGGIAHPPAGTIRNSSPGWVAMRELPDLVVPFKRPTYQRVIAGLGVRLIRHPEVQQA
jgi:hypothetical protein